MNATVTQHEGYSVAKLAGTIDEAAAAVFDAQLHSIIEVPGSRLLLDLSGSDRVTSAGLGHLVTLVSRANTKGSLVVLAQPSAFVGSIFEVTKLSKFLDVEPTVDEGIARLRASSV